MHTHLFHAASEKAQENRKSSDSLDEPVEQTTTEKELLPDVLLFVGEVQGADVQQVTAALEAVGLPVRVAPCRSEARAAIRFLPVRLVVLGLDGSDDAWSFIRYGASVGRPIPVACVSGVVTRSRILAALRRGARTFLAAPFSAEEAEDKLAPLLRPHGDQSLDEPAPPPPAG